MATVMDRIEALRGRLKERLEEIRGRLRGGAAVSPQIKIGGGELIRTVRERATEAVGRIQSLKPGIIPMLKEWKPGEKLSEILTPKTKETPPPAGTPPAATQATKEKGKKALTVIG